MSGLAKINFLIYNNSYGQVEWKDYSFLENLTLGGPNSFGIGSNIDIGPNGFALSQSGFDTPSINSTTEISFFHIPSAEEIYRLDNYNINSTQILQGGYICGDCPLVHDFAPSYVSFNATAPLGSFTINPFDVFVYNTVLASSNASGFATFMFTIRNFGSTTRTFNWGIDSGDGFTESTQGVNITPNSGMFVLAEYQYSSLGNYTIMVNTTDGTLLYSESINITI